MIGERDVWSVGWLAVAFVLLWVSSLVPHLPGLGPIEPDDAVVLVALGLAVASLPSLEVPRLDPVVSALLGLVCVAVVVDWLVWPGRWLAWARGPGRLLQWGLVWCVAKTAARHCSCRRLLTAAVMLGALLAIVGAVFFLVGHRGPYGLGVFYPTDPRAPLRWLGWGRLVGTFNLPSGKGMNGLAIFMAMLVPVGWGLALESRGRGNRARWFRRVMWGAVVTMLVALIMTGSRSIWGILLIAFGVSTLSSTQDWRALRRRLFLAVTLVAVLVVVLSIRGVRSDRPALWWAGMQLSLEKPWVGHGDTSYRAQLLSRPDVSHTAWGRAGTTPHNTFILSFYRYGVLGLLLSLWIVGYPWLWFVVRARSCGVWAEAGAVAFGVFALGCALNNLLEVPKVALPFFSLWPVLVALTTSTRGKQPAPRYDGAPWQPETHFRDLL